MPVVPFIPAIAGVAGAAIGASAQNKASKQAANASQYAADQATAEQRRQFDIAQRNQAPWLNTGTSALNQLAALYGLGGGGNVVSQPQPQTGGNTATQNPAIARLAARTFPDQKAQIQMFEPYGGGRAQASLTDGGYQPQTAVPAQTATPTQTQQPAAAGMNRF